jgi:hypothetical protein
MTETEIVNLESRLFECQCGSIKFEISISNGATGMERQLKFTCSKGHVTIWKDVPKLLNEPI